jgi:aspartate aminotransferase-like enzyme
MATTLLLLPGPVTVAPAVLQAAARPLIDHRGPEFAELLARIAGRLRPIFGTQGDVTLLGSSGTGAMEAALVNTFSPGDAVLSCPVGVFGRRFAAIARAHGCSVEVLDTPLGNAVDPQALARRLEADVHRRIAGVLLTHNETSTGVQNDLAALASAIRPHGAMTLVDSVSGLGAAPMEMDAWGFDIVVAASQKALAAPPGLAMVAVSQRAKRRFDTARGARFSFDLSRALKAAAEGQTPWTPPISIVFALDAALDAYASTGMEAAFERHARYAAALRATFEALDFELVSRPGAHSVTVVAARPPQTVSATGLKQRLRDAYGISIGGGQEELAGAIVRVGTMGAISDADMGGAICAIEFALRDLGAAMESGRAIAAASSALRGAQTVAV